MESLPQPNTVRQQAAYVILMRALLVGTTMRGKGTRGSQKNVGSGSVLAMCRQEEHTAIFQHSAAYSFLTRVLLVSDLATERSGFELRTDG
jgi:hypothetical protein